ncbi:MAG: chemotaxis protein CheW [Candidatus Competibacteraceae bacterium]|nr:chemotaxis protein CheW [Candidatus Competibacteraceae bacterium]
MNGATPRRLEAGTAPNRNESPKESQPVDNLDELVVFLLSEQRYALALPSVLRVVRAVEMTPLPKAPAIILGIINVGGEIIPVVDLRRRFQMAVHGLQWTDQLIIARTARRTVALPVDQVLGVVPIAPAQVAAADAALDGVPHVAGVLKLADGLVLIHDLEQCLSPGEEQALSIALEDDA